MSKSYEEKLLNDWEDIFRQGLLTFWVFVALKDKQLSVDELKNRIEKLTKGSYSAAEQTLYRLLRKHYDLELVDFEEVPGNSGPKRKIYTLSPLGRKLLKKFTRQNISLFHQSTVTNLIKEGGKI